MRYGVGALGFSLMLLAGLALSGSGHGWTVGAVGCLALAPAAFLATANALRSVPSFRQAAAVLVAGLVVCLAVVVATHLEGREYVVRFLRANEPLGALVAGSAYVGWLIVASLGVMRSWKMRHGA